MNEAPSARLSALYEVQKALRAIDGTGLYHFAVKATSVVLDPLVWTTLPKTERPVISIFGWEPLDRKWELSGPLGRLTDKLVTTLLMVADADGVLADRKVEVFEWMVEDVERAITAAFRLGGYANEIRMRQPQASGIGAGQQNMVALVQELEITLVSRAYGSP